MIIKDAREAAYLALLSSLRGDKFIFDSLEEWRENSFPSNVDYHFAQKIAAGSSQMALTLDYLAERMADKKKLSLKMKEKALLRLALYQFYFLDRIPLYAITNESIKLAKKYCHRTFVGYLNATLRKLTEYPVNLPEGNTPKELSIQYSYPIFFIEELIKDRSLEITKDILIAGNMPALTTVRIRNSDIEDIGIKIIPSKTFRFGVIEDATLIPQISLSSSYYIQNITPATLIANLAEGQSSPKNVLDLCSSPGGKLLAIHDLYPNAGLYANDISPLKMERLLENCEKYCLKAHLSCKLGEEFSSLEKFDLIILDVPCSNSGVFNKRPEARWRLTPEALKDLEIIQRKLLENALKSLSDNGELWYMTCSILKKENEHLMHRICQDLNLKIRFQQTILPSQQGWDGGYACALHR